MEYSEPERCTRCKCETNSNDKFCQECGLDLTKHRAVVQEPISNVLDFTPPATNKLHSPLLQQHTEILDFRPEQPLPVRRIQRPGAVLSDLHPRQERERIRNSFGSEQANNDQNAEPAGKGMVATLTRPETESAPLPVRIRTNSPMLERHTSASTTQVSIVPGPLIDLLQASLVMLTLTAIAYYIGQQIAVANKQARATAAKHAEKLVADGKFEAASNRLQHLHQTVGLLTREQLNLLNECRFKRGSEAAQMGQTSAAISLFRQIDASSPRFEAARRALVAMSTRPLPDITQTVPKRKRNWQARRRPLSSQETLSLPVLPETEKPAEETDKNVPEEAPAPEQKEGVLKRPARCSEADIAAYNSMLGKWLTRSSKVPADNGSKEDPPSFRDWLQEGKPNF